MVEPPPQAVALRLGYAALLPFVVGAATVPIARDGLQHLAAAALVAYAATVVSFLGGIHWGFGFRMSRPRAGLLVWGVVPPIVACAALLLPTVAALLLHAATLSVCFFVDRSIYPVEGAAAWLPLRARLTAIAVPCCLIGAWSTWWIGGPA